MQKYTSYFMICIVLLFAVCNPKNQDKPTKEKSVLTLKAVEFERSKVQSPKTGKIPTKNLFDALRQMNKGLNISKQTNKTVNPFGWYPVDDKFANLAVTGLTYDPNNTNIMYFSTGEGFLISTAVKGAGIWKSIDGGASWLHLASTDDPVFELSNTIRVHPFTSHVYVATIDSGVMRSTDGGNTWEQILGKSNGALSNQTADIEFTKDGGIFVSLGLRETDGIYFSSNGNAGSFVKQNNGVSYASVWRIELATSPSNENVAYAIFGGDGADTRIKALYKTTDKGVTWGTISNPGNNLELAKKQSWYDLSLAVDPNDENIVVAGGLNIWRSRDAGMTWQQLTHGKIDSAGYQYIHVDQHQVHFVNSDTVLFASDGGIFKSDDFKDDFPILYDRNKNYNTVQYYAVAIHPTAGSSILLGGTQDNGTHLSQSSGISNYQILRPWADGGFAAIDYNKPKFIYITKQLNSMSRHDDGGINPDYDTLTNPYLIDNDVLFINPFEMDPNNPELLYMASNKGLWRLRNASTATDSAWELASASILTRKITAIGISTNPPNIVFAGIEFWGDVRRIDSAHISSSTTVAFNTDVSSQLPINVYTSSIFVDPVDANHVIVSYSNYDVESVWESKTALSSNPTWESIEGNLPNIPIRWAMLHPTNPDVCYVATELGVYYTNDINGTNTIWQNTNNGLPNMRVDMLRTRKSDNLVAAATYGRGFFTGIIQSDNSIIWEERGPKNIAGRTRVIMLDPNDPSKQTFWAGSVTGGLWKTDDIGSIETEIEHTDNTLDIYPNPVNASGSIITYDIQADNVVEINMFDVSGKKVVEILNEQQTVGIYNMKLVTKSLANGVYIIQLKAGNQKISKRILYLN